MNSARRRLALLSGAALSAYAFSTPVEAATNPGILHWVSDANVDDELVISNINDELLFGVSVEDTSNAYAIVSSPDLGQIAQVGAANGSGPDAGFVTLVATNAGQVSIAGVAAASNSDGEAHARAHVERAIVQNGNAEAKGVLTLDNAGSLSVSGHAVANGAIGGTALATISSGILQNVAGPEAAIALGNDGSIEISAIAEAAATQIGGAHASASVHGIEQHAFAAHTGSVSLANEGTIEIGIGAMADGFATADASAIVRFGVAQSATGFDSGDGFAAASLENDGTISFAAAASANAQSAAHAEAKIVTAVYQHATGSAGGASAEFSNSGTLALSADVVAIAHRDGDRPAYATATAIVGGINQIALAVVKAQSSGSSSGGFYFHRTTLPTGPVLMGVENSGTISLSGRADVHGDAVAVARATATILSQSGQGSDVAITLENSGNIDVSLTADATASQTAYAIAGASGLHQTASAHGSFLSITQSAGGSGHGDAFIGGIGPATVSLSNSGTISFAAEAHALQSRTEIAAPRSSAAAAADVLIGGAVIQGAHGTEAAALVTNEGSITLDASASALGLETATGHLKVNGVIQAAIATGVSSHLHFTAGGSGTLTGTFLYQGEARASLMNSGALDIWAIAKAEAQANAYGAAYATGVLQLADGKTASAIVDNVGTFAVAASVSAIGAQHASGFAAIHGAKQSATAPDAALAAIVNDGTISIEAAAFGHAQSGGASAIAIAGGATQSALSRDSAVGSLENSGSFSVAAAAAATGSTVALGVAAAIGIEQNPLYGTLNSQFSNDGKFLIAAAASAEAMEGSAYATARATGLHVDAGNVIAAIVNKGEFKVSASAIAVGDAGSAYAHAGGFSMSALFHGSSGEIGSISGTLENSGSIKVSAKVESGNSGTVAATATGLSFNSTSNDVTVINSGSLSVEAVTGHGAPANAYGVRLFNWSETPASGDHVFTFTNDGGDLVVRQSQDGGKSWKHGMAIDVISAPNASVINFVGNGSIYGNIAIQTGDELNVKDGKSYFDGTINPTFVPLGGVSGVDLDTGLHGVGTLNIKEGGNLILADPRLSGRAATYDGPAYAFVDTLNLASNGALTFELEPGAGGVQVAGSYGQMFADTANVDGTLEVLLAPKDGLFADSYSWQNVIDGNALNGKFDSCMLGGAYAGSLLLTFKCSYDNAANVDLTLTRAAFDSVSALNRNGRAVASAIETLYDEGGGEGDAILAAGTGDAARMIGDLFLINDAADYNIALNEVSGSAYANYLQSFGSLGVHYNDLLDHSTDCEVPAGAGSALKCRSGPIHVWGTLDVQSRRADGDIEAGRMRSKRFAGLLGVDTGVGDAAMLGVSVGSVTNHTRDRQFGDSVQADGVQVGAYGTYDPGAFFAKGITTYSQYDGDSTRSIDFTPLGGTFVAAPKGDPDVHLFTASLRAGLRLPISGSLATPYLNLDYTHASLKGFHEASGNGAELTLESSKSQQTFLTGGVKWATQIGDVVPEVNVGYRHRFGDSRSTFSAELLDNASGAFDIVSSSQKRGSFLFGLSAGGELGPVDLRIAVEGEFNGDVTSHSANLKLVLPLGGRVAPPPAEHMSAVHKPN